MVMTPGVLTALSCTPNIGFLGYTNVNPTMCPAGTFKAATAPAAACTSCAAGKYKGDTTQTADMCIACPTNSGSLAGSTASTACVSAAVGYTGPDNDGGSFSACAANTFKASTGSAACTACPANTAGDGTSGWEGAGDYTRPGGTNGKGAGCRAKAGYTGDGANVAACAPLTEGSPSCDSGVLQSHS